MTKKKFEKVSPAVKVANQMLEIMAEGVCPWGKGWNLHESGKAPFNVISGREYTGITNIMMAYLKADDRLPAFVTASRKEGRFPKKGSKSIAICSANGFEKENSKTGKKEFQFTGYKYFNLFHYSDMNGIDHEAIEKKYEVEHPEGLDFNPIASCENVIDNMPNIPKIEHGGNRAFYRPSADSIGMPTKSQFHNEGEYYRTLFHELGHSTMHVTRLDRKQTREGLDTQEHEYSFEELVAELTACTIGSECGIMTDTTMQNSAAYLKGWMAKIQSNPEWIIKASSVASKAVDYIMNKPKVNAA